MMTGEPSSRRKRNIPVKLPYNRCDAWTRMADLMLVAAKEWESLPSSVWRRWRVPRHPPDHGHAASVCGRITGTIKANFPNADLVSGERARSDSRTSWVKWAARALLAMGDMLYRAGGPKCPACSWPFGGDEEVEDSSTDLKPVRSLIMSRRGRRAARGKGIRTSTPCLA